jgi:hypothetical protein
LRSGHDVIELDQAYAEAQQVEPVRRRVTTDELGQHG